MGQVHAVQFVTGDVEVDLHTAEADIEEVGDFLVGFASCRPGQALPFALRQPDWIGGKVRIPVRRRIDQDRQLLKADHVSEFKAIPFRFFMVAAERNQRLTAPSGPNRDRQAVPSNAVSYRVGEESQDSRIVGPQRFPVEWEQGLPAMGDHWIGVHIAAHEVPRLPRSRIGGDPRRQAGVAFLNGREPHVGYVAYPDLRRDRFQRIAEILRVKTQNRVGQPYRGPVDIDRVWSALWHQNPSAASRSRRTLRHARRSASQGQSRIRSETKPRSSTALRMVFGAAKNFSRTSPTGQAATKYLPDAIDHPLTAAMKAIMGCCR